MTELSLTLPKATARKRVRRRAKRPRTSPFLVVLWALIAITDALVGNAILVALAATVCGVEWHEWQIERANRRVPLGLDLAELALILVYLGVVFA